MAPIGTLYTYPNNYRAAKALVAAKYAGVEVTTSTDIQMGTFNRSAEFLAKWPMGKVPVFESADGVCLCESNAIATYVAAHKADELLGATALERAQVIQFIDLVSHDVIPPASVWMYPIYGYAKYNKEAHNKAVADMKRALAAFDKYLETRTYLVSNHVTLADIIVAVSLARLFSTVFDAEFRQPFVNVTRYVVTLANQPNFIAVLGEFHLAETALVYDPAVHDKEAIAAKAKAETEKAEKAKKEAEKPKEEKKPKKKDEDEEEEESYEDKPAGKNPLDLLPPTNFNLEAWKRFYSNNPEDVALKYFWDNYDAEGYSIWQCTYKDNKDNKAIYMTCNLLNGTFQRWERARKYAFGSFCIFGEDNDNEIIGVWVFRGKDIPAEVREADDFESYDFVPIDVSVPAKKEQFNSFLAWSEIPGVAAWHAVSPKTFNQGKVFK